MGDLPTQQPAETDKAHIQKHSSTIRSIRGKVLGHTCCPELITKIFFYLSPSKHGFNGHMNVWFHSHETNSVFRALTSDIVRSELNAFSLVQLIIEQAENASFQISHIGVNSYDGTCCTYKRSLSPIISCHIVKMVVYYTKQ
jgi:hypothetical protein